MEIPMPLFVRNKHIHIELPNNAKDFGAFMEYIWNEASNDLYDEFENAVLTARWAGAKKLGNTSRANVRNYIIFQFPGEDVRFYVQRGAFDM
jgi:hypothetical protein